RPLPALRAHRPRHRHTQALADRTAALPPTERIAAWKAETGRSQAALYRRLRKRTLDRQRIRYTPELLAAARAREAEFLGQIMPAVIRHANRRLRNLPHRREEYTQDALGQRRAPLPRPAPQGA